ncbi:MAG: HigA family addiction module antitoxin [Psychroflexus sp.]|jgi:addiction module HigA family antidote|nr:HigA family addiction module antitoxin [Psychroflexus sp.]MDR9448203.1 HigA family addiction module antitoxin [Psychroflexus sp.]
MLSSTYKLKGVHPGDLLKYELSKRELKGSHLARAIGEHKQTISAIINKRRSITPVLSIKLASYFQVSDDYFMILQSVYDVKQLKTRFKSRKPDLGKFRKVLFWDTSMDKLDWVKQKHAIIKRVLEKGNDRELNELISFYGKKTIEQSINELEKHRSINADLQKLNLSR